MANSEWPERVERTVARWCGGSGVAWVVAVSGGSDSVGLLRVLAAIAPGLGLGLSVAHLDHGVRGEAARADAAFVAGLAEALGLPFDLGEWQPTRPGRFEAEARRARYAWLAEVARARGASAVAVGHTRDDQAETILHRIVRGTGLRGLAGIPRRRPLAEGLTLVRPLLGVTRDEIRAHLATLAQPYRDDASNADTARTRARIRHDLLPRLAREVNPRVGDALVRLGEQAGAAVRSGEASLVELEKAVLIAADHNRVILKQPIFLRAARSLRVEVLRRFWRRAGWPEGDMDARRWRRLVVLAREDRVRAAVGGGIEIVTDSLLVVLRRIATPRTQAPESTARSAVSLPLPGEVSWDGGRIVATLDRNVPRDEMVDLEALEPPLWVRGAVAGDRFEPLGMGGRSMPLNDFFRGRQVDRARRGRVPLVCDQSGIVWVAGHRIAHRVRQTDETEQSLGLRYDPAPPDPPSHGKSPTSCD